MNRKLLSHLLVPVLVAGIASTEVLAQQKKVTTSVQSMAGGSTRINSVKLVATVGQPSPVGRTSGGQFTLSSGFIYTLAPGRMLAPAAASSLTAEAISTSEIILRWADNSNNEDGFRIERRVGIEGVTTFTVGPQITNYQDRGLNPGTRASYRIFAFNAGGNSLPSNSVVEITATGILGDVVRDFRLDALDVSLMVDIILQRAARVTRLDSSTADTNFDRTINVIDVVYIVREATRSLLASTSSPVLVDENDVKGELRLGAADLAVGTSVKLPMTILVNEKVTALQLKLRYDSEKLMLEEPALASAHQGMTLVTAREQDQLAILIYSLAGNLIPSGKSELLQLSLRAKAGDFSDAGLRIEGVLVAGQQGTTIPVRVVNEAATLKMNLPTAFALRQNYPNPLRTSAFNTVGTNPKTEIVYTIPVAVAVKLSIYDILGHEAAVLVNAWQTPGFKKVAWDGRDKKGNRVATGLYFYRLEAGDFVATRKMVIY
jgi:hypothetical protein